MITKNIFATHNKRMLNISTCIHFYKPISAVEIRKGVGGFSINVKWHSITIILAKVYRI